MALRPWLRLSAQNSRYFRVVLLLRQRGKTGILGAGHRAVSLRFRHLFQLVDQSSSRDPQFSGCPSAIPPALGQHSRYSLLLRLGEQVVAGSGQPASGKISVQLWGAVGDSLHLGRRGLRNADNFGTNKELDLLGARLVEHIQIAMLAICLGKDRRDPTIAKVNIERFHIGLAGQTRIAEVFSRSTATPDSAVAHYAESALWTLRQDAQVPRTKR
jgi:hypothetical protein